MLCACLCFILAWIVVGGWLLDGWLADSVIRFVIWWGVCGIMTIILMIFALYDALSVVREEKSHK